MDICVNDGAVAIAVRDYGGDGTPLVLLHGLARNLEDWGAVVPFLTTRHRVVSVDFRGHGRSGAGPWSWEAAVDDVNAVAQRLGLERPAVAGHSLGGMVAAMCATEIDRWRAAMNVDGHSPGADDEYPGIEPDTIHRYKTEIRELGGRMLPTGDLTAAQVDELISAARAQAVATSISPDVIEAVLQRSLEPLEEGAFRYHPTADVVRVILEGVENLDLLHVYRQARCPLLVIRADRDDPMASSLGPDWVPSFVAASRQRLDIALPKIAAAVDLVEVQGFDATHGLLLEAPQAVAATITEFIARAG